jgi:hypothetical protein
MSCEINWSELRLWIAPAITAFGIFISVLAAIFVPQYQKKLERIACANAVAEVLSEATARIWGRLEIRFEPTKLTTEGKRMRQFWSDSAVSTLKDFKVNELPIELVPTFAAARAGISALNASMNNETKMPPEETELELYRVVYIDVLKQLELHNLISWQVKTKFVRLPKN